MVTPRALETSYVVALLVAYVALWARKRSHQRRTTGHDPEVLAQATGPLQQFFAAAIRVLTVGVVLLVVGHGAGAPLPAFGQYPPLDRSAADLLGLAVGSGGLGVCALAQRTMGSSWRVGIDEELPGALVTAGIYRWIRNPTYLGLFLLYAGLWLIWPTTAVALLWLATSLLLEVQVRCEEEFLARVHGGAYATYKESTWRYVPWVY